MVTMNHSDHLKPQKDGRRPTVFVSERAHSAPARRGGRGLRQQQLPRRPADLTAPLKVGDVSVQRRRGRVVLLQPQSWFNELKTL